MIKQNKEITTVSELYRWFKKEFPSYLISEQGIYIKERANEIVEIVNRVFTPKYVSSFSEGIFIGECLEDMGVAYEEGDFLIFGSAAYGIKEHCKEILEEKLDAE